MSQRKRWRTVWTFIMENTNDGLKWRGSKYCTRGRVADMDKESRSLLRKHEDVLLSMC